MGQNWSKELFFNKNSVNHTKFPTSNETNNTCSQELSVQNGLLLYNCGTKLAEYLRHLYVDHVIRGTALKRNCLQTLKTIFVDIHTYRYFSKVGHLLGSFKNTFVTGNTAGLHKI